MATTQETQAANIANTLMALLSGASGIQQQIDFYSTQWTNLSAATKLNAFPTAPLLATGALGTADGSSNVANPIDTRTTDGALINRAISANNIASILTALQGISAAIKGQAVSVNGAVPSLVALVS